MIAFFWTAEDFVLKFSGKIDLVAVQPQFFCQANPPSKKVVEILNNDVFQNIFSNVLFDSWAYNLL